MPILRAHAKLKDLRLSVVARNLGNVKWTASTEVVAKYCPIALLRSPFLFPFLQTAAACRLSYLEFQFIGECIGLTVYFFINLRYRDILY